MDSIDVEIKRIKIALGKTESKYLKRDYKKHLKRLLRQKRAPLGVPTETAQTKKD